MSLINDALKRASQTHREQPREASLDTPMQPVSAPVRRSRMPVYIGFAVIIGLFVVGDLIFWKWWNNNHHAAPVASAKSSPAPQKTAPDKSPSAVPAKTAPLQPETKAAKQTAVPAPKPSPPPVTQAKPEPTPVVASAQAPPQRAPQTPAPSTSTPVTPAVSAVAVPPPVALQPSPAPQPFPAVKLRAIFYNAKNPTAMINGNTVGQDEEFDGIRVVKIERQRVVLEWQGQTKELLLE